MSDKKLEVIREFCDSIRDNRNVLAEALGMGERDIFNKQTKIREKALTLRDSSGLRDLMYKEAAFCINTGDMGHISNKSSYIRHATKRVTNFLNILERWQGSDVGRKDPHTPVPREMQYPVTDDMGVAEFPFDWITKETRDFMKNYPNHKVTLRIKELMKERKKLHKETKENLL